MERGGKGGKEVEKRLRRGGKRMDRGTERTEMVEKRGRKRM